MTNKVVVIYYSRSGTTRRAAQAIAERAQADLVELTVAPDTFPADMNATAETAQHQIQAGDLPALTNALGALNAADVLLIGGPVWGGTVATPVQSLLAGLTDFHGTVAPFYTDAGTAGRYVTDFRHLVPAGVTVKSALEATGQYRTTELARWLATVQG